MGRILVTLLAAIVLVTAPACSGGDGDTAGGDAGQGSGELQEQEPTEDGQEQPAGNSPPTVSNVDLEPDTTDISKNATARLSVTASDADGDPIEYKWAATGGSFDTIEEHRATWRAPELTGTFTVTATVTDGQGGTAIAQTTFTVIENVAPVILGLTAEPEAVSPGGHVTLSASAEDADGDPLTFDWEADGGEITGVGQSVTWIAPDVSAGEKTNYYISLTVDDGRGGYDADGVEVKIAIGYNTKTFSPVANETGTVIKNGGDETDFMRAGDNADNEAMRAFFSFDLYELRNSDVSEATIEFTHQQTVGDPFNMAIGLRGIHVYVVRYDDGGLPEFYTEPVEELTESVLLESPTVFDITKFAQRIGDTIAASDKLQFMLAFQRDTNNDSKADHMSWDRAIVTVTYAPE